jgi:N6-adenosine-specific RNA methylase IME4
MRNPGAAGTGGDADSSTVDAESTTTPESSMTRYRTIVADPPWEVGDFPANFGYEAGKACPYPTMTVDEIKALPISSFAAPEAHLYLWTIPGFLERAYDVARAWGFEPMYPLVWCKPPFGQGLGGKYASNVEFVLFCRERHGAVRITSYLADCAQQNGVVARQVNEALGTSDMAGWWLSRLPHRARIATWEQYQQIKALVGADDRFDADVRLVNDNRHDDRKCDTRWWVWPRGKHSAKPEAFLDVVEQVSPGPYVELFARRDRLGWDTWGDESLGTADMAA